MTESLLEAAAILRYFQAASARMADLPVFNAALEVELLGWQQIAEQGALGVLITPWCMTLLWQPLPERALPPKGSQVLLRLPSGDYECTLQADEQLGRYASASLCSPMQDFASQTEARTMADDVLRLILAAPEPPSPAAPTALSRRALFQRVLGRQA